MDQPNKLTKKLLQVFDDSFEETEELPPVYQEIREIKQRYGNKSFIDKGGMKVIYRTNDLITKRKVAMATLNSNSTPELYDPFIREARLTALLTHPNIIPIYDIGIDKSGSPFFTMELKEGDSLQTILNICKGKNENYLKSYPLEKRLNIFIKICDAIAYAHSQNVIHLDLKPENIQVGRFGEVLVCDWGLGKVLGSPDTNDFKELMFNPDFLNTPTRHGNIKGTPGFMAPERISKKTDTNTTTDVYSLGCMLYSILVFEPPFSGETDEVLKKTLLGHYTFPADKHIPEGLKAIVTKAMKNDPNDRYLLVENIRDDVQKYLLGFAPDAEKASFYRQLKLFYRRHRLQCISAIIFAILLSALTFVYLINIEQRRLESDHAKRRAEQALILYREEREWREDILADHSDLLEKDVLNYLFYSSLEKDPAEHMARTFLYLNRLIETYPLEESLYAKRARAHFMMQRFSDAIADFKRAGKQASGIKNAELQKLSQKYAPLVPAGQTVPDTLLAEFIEDLSKLQDFFVKYKVLNCFLIEPRPIHQRLNYIKYILKFNNKEWDSSSFSYDSQKKNLSLSYKGLDNISYHFVKEKKYILYYIYDFLDIRKLTIKNMKKFPKLFFSIRIAHIDISQSQVTPTQKFLNMKYLKRINISKKQALHIKTLKIPEHIKIHIM